jgi:signal transduction histidine kinase
MHLTINDRREFESWQDARAYLQESPVNFLTSGSYPPEGFSEDLKKRVLIVGEARQSGFYHLPTTANRTDMARFCALLLEENAPRRREPDLAAFLQTFAEGLVGDKDLRDVANEMMAETSALFEADGASVLIFDAKENILRFAAAYSSSSDIIPKLNQLEIPADQGIAGWVAKNRKSLIVNNVGDDPRFNPDVDMETAYRTHNMIASPIIRRDELLGVVEVVNRTDQQFTEADLPVLNVVATIISIFAEKARLNRDRQAFDRAAGRAEIADSVLHNIGNVLNSLNVSCSLIETKLERTRLNRFLMANQLLRDHMDDPSAFFRDHPKGQLLPRFYLRLGEELHKENESLQVEMRKVTEKTHLMQDIIDTQQTIAKMGASGLLDLIQVIEEALTMVRDQIEGDHIQVVKTFRTGKPVRAQKSKLIHVLINLFKNGIEAMEDTPMDKRVLNIETGETEKGEIFCSVKDQGAGMSVEVRDRVFTHGFTTKKHGHGFGLAACRTVMEELNGGIHVESQGPGKGSTFTLLFPRVPDQGQA